MKKSFFPRAIVPLFICWVDMVLFPETLHAKAAAVVAVAILLLCALILLFLARLFLRAQVARQLASLFPQEEPPC